MVKDIDTLKIILGLKIQQLRKDQQLSYQQLSEKTGIAISYLHSIEKGKKYPKADKILTLAKALDTEYDYLVSMNGNKRLQPIIDLLHSDFLKMFPLETFGISTSKLIELMAEAPDKINAFLSTIIKIIRSYQLQGEDFFKAALRSYQDLKDNYFEELEEAAAGLREKFGIKNKRFEHSTVFENILKEEYGITIDRRHLGTLPALREVRSYFSPKKKILYINDHLNLAQENFLIAKELGFQFLQLKDRPYETRMIEVGSFEKLLNNFKASYFSVALLLDKNEMMKAIQHMSKWKSWDKDAFIALLNHYQVTSEMLLQRLANILPHHFGISDLFFLRFYTGPEQEKFEMTKEMHLSQLHDPYGIQLDEHYCRRWVSIRLMQQLKQLKSKKQYKGPIAEAQISDFYDTQSAYLCITVAKPSHDFPQHSTSVTIGLLVDKKLEQLFPWLQDPKLLRRQVNNSCERCEITNCESRAAPPLVVEVQKQQQTVKRNLKQLE
jgi:predicted transcriptional regulator/DNA-binding XRE family transcriptional regulator